MLDKLKNLFKKPEPVKEEKPKKKPEVKLSPKEQATKDGEPYVNVLGMELDPSNVHNGAFELDWNEIFVARLVKAGYMKDRDDTDNQIVDRWFQDVCRNIALEYYEQQQADPKNRDPNEELLRKVQRRDLGGGRSEIS
jgi:hypothetical protein